MAQERQPVAMVDTPEFKQAVDAATERAVAAVLSRLPIAPTTSEGGNGDLRQYFSEMAMAISEMSHQGSGRARPVPPDVMAKREQASRDLHILVFEVSGKIREAKFRGDQGTVDEWMPHYRVVSKCYFNEQMIEPYRRSDRRGEAPIQQEIHWAGPPNDALYPINEIAHKLFALYKASVGETAPIGMAKGPDGQIVKPDERPFYLTPGGLVVKGSPPRGAFVANQSPGAAGANDPNAEFVHILGTVAPAVRQNQNDPAAQMAARVSGQF